jgi:uncharacterized protein involved in outer membrane biogenesis
MKKLLKWLLLLTLALAIGVVAVIYNPKLIKGPLENYLTGVAGYPINLEGSLEIEIGRQIEITATGINISAPDWSRQQNLISIGYLKLVLVTGSLFKDTLILDSLQIDDLHVNLESKPDGSGNWAGTRSQPPTSNGNDNGDRSARVVFNTINFNNVYLRFINGKKNFEHLLHIASLDQQQQADGMLQITMDGNYNDRPLTFSGNIGPYINLLNGSNITYSGNGNFGSLRVTASGLIDDLLQPRRPQFSLEIDGPDIDKVTSAFGIEDLGSGPFSLHAMGNQVNEYYETSIDGDIGDISLTVSAQLSDLLELDDLNLSLAISGPSLGAFTRTFGTGNWPDKPFNLNADVARVGETLNIPNLTLSVGGTHLKLDALLSDFPHLDASRIKLSITGDDIVQFRDLLGLPGIASGPFEATGTLDVTPDAIERLQVEITSSLGRATVSGILGAAPKYTGTRLHLHVDGHNAHAVMSALNIDALPEQPFNLDARIELVEQGLKVERGVLVTIEDERLELGGLVALNPQGLGTQLNIKFHGKHLNRILRHLVGDTEVPDRPYVLSGRVQFVENGFQLEKFKAEFAGLELALDGLVDRGDQPLKSGLNFELSGSDLSALEEFKLIGDKLDIFVPGQAYKATGRFAQSDQGWLLDKISGHIGETDLKFDALISNRPELTGSKILFSINGPGLSTLLLEQEGTTLPPGAFKTGGELSLSENTLKVSNFRFENEKTHGTLDLELGWPLGDSTEISFDVDIQGSDIRNLLPATDVFEPFPAPYKIVASGEKHGDLISLQHVNVAIGDLKVMLKGIVNENSANENVAIYFDLATTDLSTLGLLNGERLPGHPLKLEANFEGNARQFKLHNITGSLGESHIAGSLEVSLKDEIPNIRLTAKSDYFDIRPFSDPLDSENEEPATKDPDRLIPPTPLPLDAIAAADITLELDIKELRHQKDSIHNLDIDAVVKSGQLKVEKLAFEGPRGKFDASFSIVPTGAKRANVKFDLRADRLVLNLTGQADEKLDQAPRIDFRLHANGNGSNLQEVAGSANGSVLLGSRGGLMEGVNLSVLDTFVLDEIFSLILPKSDKEDDLDLTCAAAIFKITDGLVETDPALAFTTSRITLVSKGTLDLKTEEMRFNFNATPNNALKLSASELFNPYILVGGTLSKPAVGLDPAKVILHGGAAIGTAGLSILAKGLLDRISTAMPICEEMLVTVEAK